MAIDEFEQRYQEALAEAASTMLGDNLPKVLMDALYLANLTGVPQYVSQENREGQFYSSPIPVPFDIPYMEVRGGSLVALHCGKRFAKSHPPTEREETSDE